ncbi:dethiobiotin synthase [Paeniglutamicibacter sulfureus]|uniref:ATP-dependent dethiobiotin synthetase BioD n=1 Tax=Paeniglutamicibacter sulfureus TaxID=43666 RepID=A0ABU2BKT7_9MICC|nr:dethiobiotin synthase [Paeniglutamicibacter sulfureus]MDR7359252.1 dethiobiotin synthase [Paeniglutamicibacter sulfureus]
MILVVTGTDTDVGKTVVSAALAACALDAGRRVAIYKPTQTGVAPGQAGDVQSIGDWLGNPPSLGLEEGARLADPMAPVDAALHAGGARAAQALPVLRDHLRRVQELALENDVVIVEGAGGILVSLTLAGDTIVDVAGALGARLVVVTRPHLGTLNHTALTLEAALARGFANGVLVLGSFPNEPTALHEINRRNLRALAEGLGWTWVPGPPAEVVGSEDPGERTRILHGAGRRLAPVFEDQPVLAHAVSSPGAEG